MAKKYVEYLKLTSFGKFANKVVGPFKPGLNVVYGPNEAGKTTVNELIKGVLFGWQTSRKNVNSYKPEGAERQGSIFFKEVKTGETTELKRTKSTEDPQDEWGILADIDKDTYSTMFALTSDELLRLDKHIDLTAHLLTAGSGTSSSPARALEVVQARIKEMMSHSSQVPNSIANLRTEQEALRVRMYEGVAQAEHYRAQEKKLAELQPRKDTLLQAQAGLNEEIEQLTAYATKLETIDQALADNAQKLTNAIHAQTLADADKAHALDADSAALSSLTSQEEFRLRDALDDLDEQRIKLEHSLDNARRELTKSTTYHDVLLENSDADTVKASARKQRTIRLVLAVVVSVCVALLGAYVFVLGQSAPSLSYTIAGAAIVLVAIVLAAVGIAANCKPSKVEEEREESLRKAAWVMQQDQKTHDFAKRELHEHQQHIEAYLENHHLGAAQGSLRRARFLLDQARDERSSQITTEQNKKTLALQRAALEAEEARLLTEREKLCDNLLLDLDSTPEKIRTCISEKVHERTQIMQLNTETNRQIGEITQELQAAQKQSDFDECKLRYELIETRLSEQYSELAQLLLAQRSLQTAIAAWESKSQPEVYRLASELFSCMTGGAWQQVRMNAAGGIEVVDAIKTTREPHLLSLGTRQQLYLSLRIALLLVADNVGAALPVLCDDILVNFDEERREKAVRALQTLAEKRQIILFTCHPDIVSLVQSIDSSANLLKL